MDSQDERLISAYSIPLILIFVGIMLFVALLNGRNDLSLLTMLVLTTFAGAYLVSRISLSRLDFSARTDKVRLFPGEQFTLTLYLENCKFFPIWVQVRVALQAALKALSTEPGLCGSCGLLWHQRARFSWQITAARRGVHRLGPPIIAAADIFGFFPSQRVEKASEIIVYPRLLPLRPFALPKRDLFGIPGTRSPVHDPVYILGTRDYRSGQPARYIHWKASARRSRMQEKIFDPSERQKALLVVDVEGFAAQGAEQALEQSLEMTASLAVQLDRQGCALGFASNAEINGGGSPLLPVAGHRQQLPALLELLARLKMTAGTDIKSTLLRSMSLPWGTSAVVFSLTADLKALGLEYYFISRKIPVVFVVGRLEDGSRHQDLSFKSKIHLMHHLGYEEEC